jgi:phosphate transport system protein
VAARQHLAVHIEHDRAGPPCGGGRELTMSTVPVGHTTKAFDADLQELKRMVAEMGGRVEYQLHDANDALTQHNHDRAERVLTADAILDNLQQQVEEKAIATIAMRQPMAGDLREIIATLRIANDLERIGDLAKNIAKRVMIIDSADMPRQARRGFSHIMSLALGLLTEALDSFANGDSVQARSIRNRDEEIDLMYTSLFRELLTYMMEDSQTVTSGVHLVFCAKNIERVGDHVTNIAESVYYMVEGQLFEEIRPKADTTSLIRTVA